jgi:hypothetical protein
MNTDITFERKGAPDVRRSDRSLNRYSLGGSVAGTRRRMFAVTAPMFAVPATFAIQATAWDTASHTAKGNTPRPLELPGGSTG